MKYNLVLGEVGSFAHQYHDIKPDIICMAKGMGNGFPIGGILIVTSFEASYGLGTTFGSHLVCAASIAVLDIIESQSLMENAKKVEEYFMEAIKIIPENHKRTRIDAWC
jgi:acetylornithine aminotransferase